MNAYLLKKKVSAEIMRGVVLIDLLVFGVCFAIIAVLTFLPPIILIGLICLFLGTAYLMLLREQKVA